MPIPKGLGNPFFIPPVNILPLETPPSPPVTQANPNKVDTEAEALFVLKNKFNLFDTARYGVRDELAILDDFKAIAEDTQGQYTEDVKDAAKFFTEHEDLFHSLAGEDDMVSLGEASAASDANPVELTTPAPSSSSQGDFSYANALGTLSNKFDLMDGVVSSDAKDGLIGWDDLMAIRESGEGVYPEDVVKTAILLTDNDGEYFSLLAGHDDGVFTREDVARERTRVQQETDGLPNGSIDPASQAGNLGDCWVLASINAVANDVDGKAIIKNSITNNPDGTYSVRFRGASDKVYTVTQEMLQNNPNSSGDREMAIIEEAARQYYAETQKDAETQKGRDIGKGGWMDEAFKLLTGQKSTIISSAEELQSIVEKDPDGLTLSFSATPGSGGRAAGSGTEHAYTVTSIDYNTNTVYYTNPWDSGNVRTMSIDDLLKSPYIAYIETAA